MRGAVLIAALLAGCASVPSVPTRPAPVTVHHPVLPTSASMIGTSTFATVLDAPPDETAVAAVRQEHQRPPARIWYGKEQGLTEKQGRQAQAEQGRLMMEFGTLRNRLPREQPNNYVDSMLRHKPSWAYVFFFRREPEATLRRYTKEPKFEAELAKLSAEDRERLIAPWNERWRAEGIPFTYGLDAVYPVMDVQLGIVRADYRALATSRSWGDPPEPIELKFSAEPVRPAVDPGIANLIRGFAHERYATLLQLEALGTGKLILRDGCLKVMDDAGAERVAVFHMETGIGLDEAGYLALIDRMTGKVRGRIGEQMAWGAPNAIPEKAMVGLEALSASCPGELVNIGNPESHALFRARYPRSSTPVSSPPPPLRN